MVIKIIIVTCNRLPLLLETLLSVINQKIENNYTMDIVVSDNSTNDETEKYFLSHKFHNVTFIRRFPTVSGIQHFKINLREVDSDYFMIFHDDDVMGDEMISKLMNKFTPSTVAVASNAYILKNNIKTNNLFTSNFYSNKIISKKKNLLSPYLYKNKIVPFPGYLYKRIASEIEIDLRYGKYVDVYFLSKVVELGPITVLNEPLYHYRTHEGQDSSYSDFLAKSHLVNYILKECGFSRKDKIVISHRLQNVYDELRTRMLAGEQLTFHKVFHFTWLCVKSSNLILILKMFFRMVKYNVRKQ